MKYNHTEFINKDNEEMILCAECGHESFLNKDGFYECGTCGHYGYIGEEINENDFLYNIKEID